MLLSDGEPAGTAATTLRRVQVGGKAVMAGVACDFAVDQAHRFLQPALLLQRAVTAAVGEGIAFIYGLPNSRAAGAVQRVGYKEVGQVDRYAAMLRMSPFLKRHPTLGRVAPALGPSVDWGFYLFNALKAPKNHRYRARELNEYDERFDVLWENRRLDHPVACVRDSQFLRWRYQACPLRDYRTVGLLNRDGSGLSGYGVFYIDEGRAFLCDFLCEPEGMAMSTLLSGVSNLARKAGATALSITCRVDESLKEAMKRSGFVLRPIEAPEKNPTSSQRQKPADLRLIQVFAEGTKSCVGWEDLSRAWYFTPGDEPYN
jgi:hypothetical protein